MLTKAAVEGMAEGLIAGQASKCFHGGLEDGKHYIDIAGLIVQIYVHNDIIMYVDVYGED